ncbi:MAG: AAC(3) family N-acetyltransferase [Lachnospiraceae bacterium]|nr:AAC(3) family N-acetyltransferase [Lachnospiraceae bacterium]
MSDFRDQYEWLSVLDPVEIKKNDTLYISSELLWIIWKCKRTGAAFDGNLLLDYLQELVGPGGTLLIPTYSFDFSNKGTYDRRKTKSAVGYLGNVALAREDFQRTRHPMHSFAVWGKYQSEFVRMDNSNSFGEGSPFSLMFDLGTKEIGIGLDNIDKACTFIHHIEVLANVPYRFIKEFQGSYTDLDGSTREYTCEYSARDLSIGYKTKVEELWQLMAKSGGAKRWVVDDIPIYSIDMAMVYQDLYRDMTENKMAGMMDFTVDRDILFGGDYQICKK